MNKLPVFRTFGRAVGFTLWNFFTIFRLSWFPLVVLFATHFAAAMFLFWQHGFLRDGRPPLVDPISIGNVVGNAIFLNLLMMVLEAIVIAAVAVSIHRIILFGDRKPGVWLNFPFGGTEFRYVLMGVVSFLIILAALSAIMAPALYVLSGGDFEAFFSKLQQGMLTTGGKAFAPEFVAIMSAYFAAWVFALYFVLRLMVWPPAIVATRRFSLGEAWRLTKGNVWRLFGLCVLVFVVFYLWIFVLAGAAYWYYTTKMKPADAQAETQIVESVKTVPVPATTEPSQTVPAPAKPAEAQDAKPPTPDAEPATEADITVPSLDDGVAADERLRETRERMMLPYQAFAPLMWFFQLIFYMLATGFGVALLSYSYKALKGYEIHEPIPEGE